MSARDYAAEYQQLRLDARHAGSIAERAAVQRKADRLATAAERAGVHLDIIALDEAARVQFIADRAAGL